MNALKAFGLATLALSLVACSSTSSTTNEAAEEEITELENESAPAGDATE